MSSVIVIAEDGTVTEHEVEGNVSLGFLSKQIGGTVDVTRITANVDAWIHDEGLYVCGPNFTASYAIMRVADDLLHRPLHGPIVFARCDDEGDTVGLRDEDAALIKRAAEEWNAVVAAAEEKVGGPVLPTTV